MEEKKYKIAVGRSRTETEWKNRLVTWAQLVDKFREPRRTAETSAEYAAMSRADKGRAKDKGGFVGGHITGGRRKGDAIACRSLVTLDIDYGQADTPDIIADMLSCAWALYSTHSHTSATPRYRLVVPLDRDVTPDEYIPIARKVAEWIDIDIFDSSTYEPARLMYWPSCPKDGEYVFRQGEGEPLDADAVLLENYTDWRNVEEWPIDRRTSRLVASNGRKQEDPTTKGGVIGAFCRSYSISEAIDAFLSDVYAPTGHDDRYTYVAGTTGAGLVVYEDKWAYSHHGTDPCCEKLCNAFDLVRLHKFGELDQDADINTPVAKLPSFVAMDHFAREDKKVKLLMIREQTTSIEEDFADLPDDEDDSWKGDLQVDGKNRPLPTPFNFGLILRNDPKLRGCVRRDLFCNRDVLTGDLPWRPKHLDQYWTNSDDNGLIGYMSEHYVLQAKTNILDALDLYASQNYFHPVRDYLNALEWDGVARLDELLIDYFGAPDTELTRAVTRKHFVAAVARVMTPGIKYDYVLTLIGAQGIGKSTFLKTMGKDKWCDDSLNTIEGKEAMEHLRGKWLLEFAELTNYNGATSEAYKAFISKTDDSYRPAYGRKTEIYPRQCVFFATTHDSNFLKGDTGNRRFWLIDCGVEMPMKDPHEDLPGEVDQIWAEAVHFWKKGEKLYLPHDLEKEAWKIQEEHNEIETDDRAGLIGEYIHKEIPTTWDSMTMQQRADWFRISSESTATEPRMKRETVCAVEVYVECFQMRIDEKLRYKTRVINQMLRKRKDLVELDDRTYDKVYGRQRRYRIIQDNGS